MRPGGREITLDAVLARAALPVGWRLIGHGGAIVSSITHDSRRVRPNSVFCCVRGLRHDGHAFAVQAVAAGASALIVDHPLDVRVAQVVVDDVRLVLGPLSCAVYGNPSHRMDVIGVTGTNGKTTTTSLLAGIFRHVGRPSSSIGTLNGTFTTPEAPDLQAQLTDLADAGITTVAMEVSSHALAQHRVDGMRFVATVFTNLGRDHLDLHGSLEAYFDAKARLFDPELSALGIVNADDEAGRRILNRGGIPMVPFSLSDVSHIEVRANRIGFVWRDRSVTVPLGGAFNVANSLAAATTAVELGVALDDVVEALAHAQPVPGRFESVEAGQDFHVVVDFAHTPDGLEAVLGSARGAAGGHRVLVVFGCGGDRDREKRPEMGAIAANRADLVIITSDNPRSEDPRAIIDEILAGVPSGMLGNVLVEPDRAIAMEAAFRIAHPGDVVVVAGKGHETTQTIGDQVIEFDDRVVAGRILDGLR